VRRAMARERAPSENALGTRDIKRAEENGEDCLARREEKKKRGGRLPIRPAPCQLQSQTFHPPSTGVTVAYFILRLGSGYLF